MLGDNGEKAQYIIWQKFEADKLMDMSWADFIGNDTVLLILGGIVQNDDQFGLRIKKGVIADGVKLKKYFDKKFGDTVDKLMAMSPYDQFDKYEKYSASDCFQQIWGDGGAIKYLCCDDITIVPNSFGISGSRGKDVLSLSQLISKRQKGSDLSDYTVTWTVTAQFNAKEIGTLFTGVISNGVIVQCFTSGMNWVRLTKSQRKNKQEEFFGKTHTVYFIISKNGGVTVTGIDIPEEDDDMLQVD